MFREQQRAQKAYEAVKSVSGQQWKEKFGGLCIRLPGLIQTNGLCLALAFLEAKGKTGGPQSAKKPEYDELLTKLAEAMGCKDAADLSEQARKKPAGEYLRLTEEAMHCAVYFKRYSEAILPEAILNVMTQKGE